MKKFLLLVVFLTTALAQAQPSASKAELVTKLLQLQQASIEAVAQSLAERPALQMMQQAGAVLQSRVAADKREALAKTIEGEVQKYLADAAPVVRASAVKLAPETVGALLTEKFSEDELRQIIAIMESPVNRKFTQMGAELQRALVEKLVAQVKGEIDPKIKKLEQAIGKQLGLSAAAPATSPAKAASK